MRIKFSDYILEQSISDSTTTDIEEEKFIAEVEVTSAIIESYMNYIKHAFITEAADSETVAASSDDSMDSDKTDDMQDAVDESIEDIEHPNAVDKAIDKLKVFWKCIKTFFKAVWSWIIHTTTRLVGLISKLKLDMLINKMNELDTETRAYYKKLVPEQLKAYIIDDDSSDGNPFLDIANIINYYHKFFNLFKAIAVDSDKIKKKSSKTLQDFISESNKFCKEIDVKLKSMRVLKRQQKFKGVYVGYDDMMEILKYIRAQTNLEWYSNAKMLIDDRSTITKIINKFNEDCNEENIQNLYKVIKDIYSNLTLYITAFMNMISQTLENIHAKNPKFERKVPKNEN